MRIALLTTFPLLPLVVAVVKVNNEEKFGIHDPSG